MPTTIAGVQYYTKAEIDQILTGGVFAGLTSKNALIVVVPQTGWTAQSGGALDGWYYADITHGRTTALLAVATAFKGADETVYICDGSNSVQETQSASVVRIWFQDQPQYDIMFLVCYA